MRISVGEFILFLTVGLCAHCPAWALPQVNYVLEELYVTENVPGTTVTTMDDIENGNWSFSETNMVGLSTGFDNNRHLFKFSENGVSPVAFANSEAWEVNFDVRLDATLVSPRKAFNFVLFNSGSIPSVSDSSVNLTTNRSPVPTGASAAPGEAAQFSGQFNFLRLIGPPDGPASINPNPTVGYTTGTTIHMRMVHTPSPDNGVTPAGFEFIYTDSSGSYTTADSSGSAPADPTKLRNSGQFVNGYGMGFIIQGIAHSGTPVDSYGVTITNFQIDEPSVGLLGDFNEDGNVDAADYVVFRKHQNTMTTLPNDNEIGGTVGAAHYDLWRAHFGSTVGSGSGAFGSAVPEPSSWLLLAMSAAWIVRLRGSVKRRRFTV